MQHELFLDHDILAYFDFQSFETWWLLYDMIWYIY